MVCGHVSRWSVSLGSCGCMPRCMNLFFSVSMRRDLCVLCRHHSKWFCLNLQPPRGLGSDAYGRTLLICVGNRVCLQGCMWAQGVYRPLLPGPTCAWERRDTASSPGPSPGGDRALACAAVTGRECACVVLGAGRPVEPGGPPAPFPSLGGSVARPVIQCVCLFLCLSLPLSLVLCLSLLHKLSLTLAQVLCLDNFLFLFSSLNLLPPTSLSFSVCLSAASGFLSLFLYVSVSHFC